VFKGYHKVSVIRFIAGALHDDTIRKTRELTALRFTKIKINKVIVVTFQFRPVFKGICLIL